ncbi:MAG: YjjG family noncanonical pyrimidine nucleotidase [Saprospiraceae bacterium]
MSYDWILFDADRTLFDFDRSARRALQHSIEAFDIPYYSKYQKVYQEINKQCWKDFEENKIPQSRLGTIRFELFLAAIKFERDFEAMSKFYLQQLAASKDLLPGAEALLGRLHGNHKMLIVTNGLKEVQRPRIANAQLNPYFHEIIVSDEIGVAKPYAAYFDYAFEKMNFPPKEKVIIIGDSINSDIKGGRDYGIDTCWYNPNALLSLNGIEPTYDIRSLEEIDEIVAGWER